VNALLVALIPVTLALLVMALAGWTLFLRMPFPGAIHDGVRHWRRARRARLPRSLWPDILRRREVKAVYVGTCGCWRFPSLFMRRSSYAAAHAHPYLGIICFASPSDAGIEDTVIHELAHVLAVGGILGDPGEDPHGPVWRLVRWKLYVEAQKDATLRVAAAFTGCASAAKELRAARCDAVPEGR
jgi:hypothetical protein